MSAIQEKDIVELWLTIYMDFECWSLDGDLQEMFIQDYKEKQVTSQNPQGTSNTDEEQ